MTQPMMEGAPLIAPSSTDHPLYEQIVEACKTVYDPEIPVNIYDLGLIYTVEINDANEVRVIMTLTAPGCPVAGEMPGWVADAIEPLAGVKQVDVEMTFQPQWGMDMMSDEARLELGFMQDDEAGRRPAPQGPVQALSDVCAKTMPADGGG